MYEVIKGFNGSPDGCRVIAFVVGEKLDENEDFPQSLIEVALAEKWVKKDRAKKQVETK